MATGEDDLKMVDGTGEGDIKNGELFADFLIDIGEIEGIDRGIDVAEGLGWRE